MHRCTHKAAGGTIHRLKPGPATIRPGLNTPPEAIAPLILSTLSRPPAVGTAAQADDPSFLMMPASPSGVQLPLARSDRAAPCHHPGASRSRHACADPRTAVAATTLSCGC